MANDVSVMGLVGLSFSGSTVLNYVLGAHPGVYGGSELYRLISTDSATHCGCCWCHDGCDVLSDARIATMNERNFYHALAEFTGKKIIVDTSKTLPWFEDMFPRQKKQGISLSLMLLTKHPLRQLAAFMGWQDNYLFKCGMRSVAKRMLVDPSTAFSREKMHLSYWLDVMIDFYDAFYSSPLLESVPHFIIRYEDFVEQTGATLSPVLAQWGLSFDPETIDYHKFDQHGVGGNAGVIRMINTEDGDKKFRSKSADYILDYYDNCEGLTMDDSYRDAFSQPVLEWIIGLSKYKKLCAKLHYSETLD